MAQLIGPDFIALQVKDLDSSRRFYEDVLGLTTTTDGPPHAVVFDTKPIPFAIRTPLVDLAEAAGRLGWGVALWINCDDADALHDQIVAAGGVIIQPLSDGGFGRQFSFQDPDGYAIVAHQNP